MVITNEKQKDEQKGVQGSEPTATPCPTVTCLLCVYSLSHLAPCVSSPLPFTKRQELYWIKLSVVIVSSVNIGSGVYL